MLNEKSLSYAPITDGLGVESGLYPVWLRHPAPEEQSFRGNTLDGRIHDSPHARGDSEVSLSSRDRFTQSQVHSYTPPMSGLLAEKVLKAHAV